MEPKFETLQQLTDYLKTIREDVERYISSHVNLDEIFAGIPAFDKTDKSKAIDFIRQYSVRMPTFLAQRRRLCDEYLAQREDIPENIKSLTSSTINIGTDLFWYLSLQSVLEDLGVDREEIDRIRIEYLEPEKTL